MALEDTGCACGSHSEVELWVVGGTWTGPLPLLESKGGMFTVSQVHSLLANLKQ